MLSLTIDETQPDYRDDKIPCMEPDLTDHNFLRNLHS